MPRTNHIRLAAANVLILDFLCTQKVSLTCKRNKKKELHLIDLTKINLAFNGQLCHKMKFY